MTRAALVVEVAVQDPAGARTAIDAGAQRVELCSALTMGGLTPSSGAIDAVCAAIGAERVNVLLRPRPGGFVYDADEIDVVTRDIRAAVARGVGGVVVGALTESGETDLRALRSWQEAAGDTPLVFHRAIDASAVPDLVFDDLLAEGVDRVLSSGGAVRSVDGIGRLAEYERRAQGRLQVVAGGGVRAEDVRSLAEAGISAVHVSARSAARHGGPSGPGGGDPIFDITDAAIVATVVEQARGK